MGSASGDIAAEIPMHFNMLIVRLALLLSAFCATESVAGDALVRRAAPGALLTWTIKSTTVSYPNQSTSSIATGTFALDISTNGGASYELFLTYCTQVGHPTPPVAALNYAFRPLSDAFTSSESDVLRIVWKNAFATSTTGPWEAAAFQAIVWELASDDTFDLSVSNGQLFHLGENEAAIRDLANAWYSNAIDGTWTSKADLVLLKNTDIPPGSPAGSDYQDLLFEVPSTSETPQWERRLVSGPSPSVGHALVYDAARQRVVLFSGNDTWEWDGSLWTHVAAVGPSVRRFHAMAYDAVRSRVVLFGGEHFDGTDDVYYGDTWEWDGSAWAQVAVAGPSARSSHAMAYDASRERVILVGGLGSDLSPLDDTWEWNGSSWLRTSITGPSARYGHKMAYDATRRRAVLFGGRDGNVIHGDTWVWDGSTWLQVGTGGPSERLGHAMAYDAARARIVLFGGYSAAGVQGDTWEWNGLEWSRTATSGPSAREQHALAYDVARGQLVLFGGSDLVFRLVNDTWERSSFAVYTQPNCQPLEIQSGVRHVVFITHGCCTDDCEFMTTWETLGQDVRSWIDAHVSTPNEWQVVVYDWTDDSTLIQIAPLPIRALESALSRARAHGRCQGTLLAQACVDHSIETMHFISHSAGSGLIAEAAKKVRAERGDLTRIHSTYLDAFAGAFGELWQFYGRDSDWADHYRTVDLDTGLWTHLRLKHAHNVDVTRLDPCRFWHPLPIAPFWVPIWESSHGWPREFYRWTLSGQTRVGCDEPGCDDDELPPLACSFGYGWPHSPAAWAAVGADWPFEALQSQYPVNNFFAVALACDERSYDARGAGPEFVHATELNDALDITVLAPQASVEGVEWTPSGFRIEAEEGSSHGPEGNTTWVYASIPVDEPVNVIRFDAQFVSTEVAEGLLSVFVGDHELSIDERFTPSGEGLEEFIFGLPEEAADKPFVLGFRLDAFGPGRSKAVVDNIQTGFSGILPGEFELWAPDDGVVIERFQPQLQWQPSPGARTYNVRVAEDPGFTSVLEEQSGVTATSTTTPPLLLRASTTYYWSVTASNPLGEAIGSPGSRSFTTPPACGDGNGDGIVDFDDLVSALSAWGSHYPGSGPGDADRNGFVDFDDLTFVLSQWIAQCP